MPISPRPFTLVCAHCSWRKTVLPHNDLASLGPAAFILCPECHTPSLEGLEANRHEILRTRLEQFLSHND